MKNTILLIILFSFHFVSNAQNSTKDVNIFYEIVRNVLPKKERNLLNFNASEKIKIKLFSKIDSLNFGNYKLQSIPLELFELTNLKYLHIPNCVIKQLPPEIRQLKKLKTLILEETELEFLPKEIGALRELETLTLSLKTREIVESLGHIEGFLIQGIKELPKEIGKLKKLKTLILHNIPSKHLPKSFKKLQKLEKLEINFHTLTTLPKEIKSLKNLKYLHLSHGKLQGLPKKIGKLERLEVLNLDDNYLKFLPKEIGNLKSLKNINLNDNQLRNLPKEIGNLEKLEKLRLSLNRLRDLPEEMSNLNSLTYLDLHHNFFEKAPKVLQDLGKTCKISFNTWTGNSHHYLITTQEFNKGNFQKSYEIMLNVCQRDSANFQNWQLLSWYSLFVGEYDTAIKAGQKSLKLNSVASDAEKNIALAYLLQNDWENAQKIYLKWKDKTRNNMPLALSCNESFLQDIFELEFVGIKHKDFKKVKRLLK